MATYLSSNSYLGLIQETTRGTTPSSGTAAWIPVMAPQVTPNQTFLRDEALRGLGEAVYDQVASVRHDEVDFSTYLYADTFPWLATAVLGGNDSVSGSSLYTHKVSNYQSVTNASQPRSFSIVDFDGANWFTLTGAQASELTVTFGADKAAEVKPKFMTNPYTALSSQPGTGPFSGAYSMTTEHLIPAWSATASIAGSSVAYVQEGEIKIDRKTTPIYTMGNQGPYQNFAGPLEVTGRLLMVVASQSDPFSTGSTAYGLFRNPVAQTITLTDPTLNHSVAFQTSATQYHDIKRSVGKIYTEIEVQFTCNANATDESGATNSTSLSSILVTTVNAQSTAYQTGY